MTDQTLNGSTPKEEDLILGDETAAEADAEVEFYDYSDTEFIAAACAALDAMESANPLTAAATKRVNRTKWRCIKMIEFYIKEMYDMTFEKDDDEDNN